MLSPRQQQTYRFIQHYTLRHGHAPLLSEIAAGLGIRSKGVVHRYLQALAREGLIELQPGRHRGIRLLAADLSELRLPLLGRIAAGLPIEAIPDLDEINLADFFTGPDRFVLRVDGDSMIEAGILNGDMVVVEKRDWAKDHEIVVALIDNEEATLKRLRNNHDGSVTLIPANSAMPPMVYSAERVRIQGVVVGQMRAYK
jgi:repressor LexA